MTTYRGLEVYQRSLKVRVAVHKLVLSFPGYERFDLADQMRRASTSIPAHMAEGYGRRRSAKEFKHSLAMAFGSANKMIVHLEITQELGYAQATLCHTLTDEYTLICKMLYRLIENWPTHVPSSMKPVVKQTPSDL